MLADRGLVRIGQVRTLSLGSAQAACESMGGGSAIPPSSPFDPADVFLIGGPDATIEASAEALATDGALASNPIVFHCSGALSSERLAAARNLGAQTASLHPARSFTHAPVTDFEGTFCAVEGTEEATVWLTGAFETCGGRVFHIAPEAKLLYHASAVIACNYFVTLIDAAMNAQALAGLDRESGLALLRPLVEGTVRSVFELGPEAALTGPIVRGERELVDAQARALADADPELGELYRFLGRTTAQLARRTEGSDEEGLKAIESMLASDR